MTVFIEAFVMTYYAFALGGLAYFIFWMINAGYHDAVAQEESEARSKALNARIRAVRRAESLSKSN